MKKTFLLTIVAAFATLAMAKTDIVFDQPAGNLKSYTRLGRANSLSGSGIAETEQSGYIYLVYATDGSGDIWVKDPISLYNTGAWVKGKLSEDKKSFKVPVGQHLSYSNTEDDYCFMGVGTVSGNSLTYDASVTEVEYTIDDNVIHLRSDMDTRNSPTKKLGVFWEKDKEYQGYADWASAYIDMDYNPENPVDYTQPIAQVPEDLETSTYAMMLMDLTFDNNGNVSGRELLQTDANVGFKDGMVYIQGLSGMVRDGWVAGTVSGNTITIASGQYQGTYNYDGRQYPIYLLGYDSETKEVKDIVFTYDPESGTMELEEGLWLVDNADPNAIEIAFGVYESVMLLPGEDAGNTIPADLQTEDYMMMLFDLSFDNDNNESGRELLQTTVKVGIKDGKIYIQGLSGYNQEAWAVGTVNGTVVNIPAGQNMGTYNYNGTDYPIYLLGCDKETEETEDLMFIYNAEEGTLELLESLWMVESPGLSTADGVFAVYDSVYLIKVGGENAITNVETKTAGNAPIYNLQGMQVKNPQKGIFIQNGKKFVKK